MPNTSHPSRSLPVLLILCACTRVLPGQPPDFVFVNGRAFTGVPERPWAEAVAVRGTRILAVGTSGQILALAGPATRRIDLAGKLITPGFNDAHIHHEPPDGEYITAKPINDPTCGTALDAVKQAIARMPTGKPLLVRIGRTAFFDPHCTASALDQLAPNRPVLLKTFTAQAAIVNQAAAKLFGILPDDPPVLGGFFGKDMNSTRWDGVVHAYANFSFSKKLSTYDEQAFRNFEKRAAEFGITSLQIMSWNPTRLVELLSKVQPALRIRVMSYLVPEGRARPKLLFPKVPAAIADRVTVSGVKWTLDGSPIEFSSAFRKPYPDNPGTSGKVNFSPEELRTMFDEARKRDVQLILHTIGGRAIDAALQALEATGGKSAWANRRVRLEHAFELVPDQFARVKELGVVAVLNPQFFPGGPQLVRSILQSGIPLVLASDNAMNPHQNVMFASTRENMPEEALSVEQAVIAYTRMAAYAEFREKEKGTLEPGKLADLAVLSQNIFDIKPEEMPKTKALLTMVGGVIVHATQPFN